MERTADSSGQPAAAYPAPTGWVVAGAGPGAKHRIFATLCRLEVLEAEGVTIGVLSLRFDRQPVDATAAGPRQADPYLSPSRLAQSPQ